ncbi:hypothetical protein J2Z60_001973 [Lactobacillus colini]|uniref:S-layer protein C-terminal domain-containing protein n=1 Tax=Lactobacillus colini TaxID=1819254 RepID=A0ABS4MGF4_9LACO|nr:SLAP domain-containing protein [Lactobacillus colini]MBP2058782.1 hypothetical protein [Lactobacillus colini]
MKKGLYKIIIGTSLLGFCTTISPYIIPTKLTQAQTKGIKRKLYQKSYVYNSKGKVTGTLPKGTSLKTFGSKTIKKVKFYKIGANQYIKQANFSKAKKQSSSSTSSNKKTSSSKVELKNSQAVIAYLNKKKGKKDWFVLNGTSAKNDYFYALDDSGHNYLVYTNGTIKKIDK